MSRNDVASCILKGNTYACKRMKLKAKNEEKIKHKKLVKAGKFGMDTASVLLADPGYV